MKPIFCFFGRLTKSYSFELQLLTKTRNASDGVTFFSCLASWDRFESEHNPSFRVELTFFNIYSHLLVHRNNP